MRILGSLVAILLVFLITAILVKVPMDALPFFVVTMMKIMLINCKPGWVGTWGRDLPTYLPLSFTPTVGQREISSSLWVVRIQKPERAWTRCGRGDPGSGERRATQRQDLLGVKQELQGPRPPTRLLPPLLMPTLFPSVRCHPAGQPVWPGRPPARQLHSPHHEWSGPGRLLCLCGHDLRHRQ